MEHMYQCLCGGDVTFETFFYTSEFYTPVKEFEKILFIIYTFQNGRCLWIISFGDLFVLLCV